MLVLALSGCGTTETKPETAGNNDTSQSQQQAETQTQQQQAEQPTEETMQKPQEEQKPEDKTQTQEQTNPETKTEEATDQKPAEQKEEKLYSEGEFDGHYIKCKLPDKWIAKEEPSQGYATIMLDPAQNAGVGIQTVEDNKDSAQLRAEGVAKQFNGIVEDVKFGNNSYKRIKTTQKDPATQKDVQVDYLICVVGSKAYYLSTPIYDQQAMQELLANILFK